MAKLVHAERPQLKRDWDAYGHAIPFEKLDGIKVRPDGCYVVVRWLDPATKLVQLADLARVSTEAPWEMQNDGFEPISESDWAKLRIVPECDWFEIPGNPSFRSLG